VTCAVCGNPCEYHIRFDGRGRPLYAPLQTRFRALYFNHLSDVDFCGAACSLAWHERRRQPNEA
jgi:hypothetical protein